MPRLDPAIIQRQIANLILQYPDLAEDQILRTDMVEGSTDAFSFLSQCARWIGEDEALCEGTTAYIKALQERRTRVERRVEAFRSLALAVMQAADLPKAELPECTMSVRNGSARVIIFDEAALPGDACKIKREPDKTIIKTMLQQGFGVAGATLSNGEPTLSIRTK